MGARSQGGATVGAVGRHPGALVGRFHGGLTPDANQLLPRHGGQPLPYCSTNSAFVYASLIVASSTPSSAAT